MTLLRTLYCGFIKLVSQPPQQPTKTELQESSSVEDALKLFCALDSSCDTLVQRDKLKSTLLTASIPDMVSMLNGIIRSDWGRSRVFHITERQKAFCAVTGIASDKPDLVQAMLLLLTYPMTSANAAWMLGELHDSRAVRGLCSLLTVGAADYPPEARANACLALSMLKSAEAIDSLVQGLIQEPEVKVASVAALIEIGGSAISPILVDILSNPPRHILCGDNWPAGREPISRMMIRSLQALHSFGNDRALADLAIAAKEYHDKADNWYTLEYKIAKYAAELITDCEQLTRVATGAATESVRRTAEPRVIAAGGTLPDQKVLKRLTELCPTVRGNDEIAERAYSQITDTNILRELALGDGRFCTHAARRFTDAEDLACIVNACKSRAVLLDTLGRIEDGPFLVRYAFSGAEEAKIAVERITDQVLLSFVAMKSPHWETRLIALNRIDDADAVCAVAESDPAWNVRIAAVRNIVDKACLRRVIESDLDGSVAEAAVDRLRSLGDAQPPDHVVPSNDIERLLMHLVPCPIDSVPTYPHYTMHTIKSASALVGKMSQSSIESKLRNAKGFIDELVVSHDSYDGMLHIQGVMRVSKDKYVEYSYASERSWLSSFRV